MFGSYNKFDARVHVDAHIVPVVDFLTSLLASIVVFSTLGHSAHVLGVPVKTVAKGGQGLAFVAYPEVSVIKNQRKGRTFNFFQALSQLPVGRQLPPGAALPLRVRSVCARPDGHLRH